jgi:hypothetical protein
MRSAMFVGAGVAAVSWAARADWITRFESPAEVTANARFGSNCGGAPALDQCPIVAVANDSDRAVRIVAVRFLNSRYIGLGDPALDDWRLAFRTSKEAVGSMTAWDAGARVVECGAPTRWEVFPGALDREGRPVFDTTLGDLARQNLLIPAHSVGYLGIANLAPAANGFTFTMMTDRRLAMGDFGFTQAQAPGAQPIPAVTGGEFSNLAVNVELQPAADGPGVPID